MHTKHRLPFTALAITALAIGITACDKLELSQPVSFATDIKPILARCVECHQSEALFGDLNLENHDLAFKPRAKGPVITPGSPDKSPLYLVLSLHEGDKTAMPPTGHRISVAETALIKRWIEQGATWPTGADGVVKPSVARDPKGA